MDILILRALGFRLGVLGLRIWTGFKLLRDSPSVTFIYFDSGVKVMMFGFTWTALCEPNLKPQSNVGLCQK